VRIGRVATDGRYTVRRPRLMEPTNFEIAIVVRDMI